MTRPTGYRRVPSSPRPPPRPPPPDTPPPGARAGPALADIPPAGRAVAPGRTGLYLAGLPAQATADIGHWVRRQLAMHAPGGAAAGGARLGGARAGGDGPDVLPGPQLCSLRA